MLKRGDIVWGKLRTFPWWPAIVLNPEDCGRDQVARNKFWLFWFGDHKVTQVECSQILDFQKHFMEKCVPKMKKALKSAIQEVLTILAARCNIKNSDPSSLFEWAKKGFKTKLRHPSHNSKSLELPDIVINALKKEAFKRKPVINALKKEAFKRKPVINALKKEAFKRKPVINALKKEAFKRKRESTSEDDSEDDEIVNVLADVLKGNTSLEDICVMCCRSGKSFVIPHPFFVGGVCRDCSEYIPKIVKSPKGLMNDICILCGQGGDLVYCCNSLCLSAYCETCINYMTPKETLSEILKDNDWKCYLCLPNPDSGCLIKKREIHLAVDRPSRIADKTRICVMGLTDAVLSILMKKMIAVDSFSYMLPRASNRSYDDFSRKEIEDISPDFIYGSFFVSSTAVDKDESRESFYELFYQFLFRLVVTRPSKPYVFFMYMCDAEILDPFIEKRVERFLQVRPTIIELCTKKVHLWSNLPAIKGIKDNNYRFKKSRGFRYIEEDILNKFLEPLKDYFMQD